MLGQELQERFWTEQWVPSQTVLQRVYGLLAKEGTLPTREIAEHAVRFAIESHAEARGSRVYSPEQTYSRGEIIFFFTEGGRRRFAQVIDVEPGHSTTIHGQHTDYVGLHVRFVGELTLHTYVSNCPNLHLRFSDTAQQNASFMTPGAVVTRFYQAICERLRTALFEDGRFTCYRDRWARNGDVFLLTDRQVNLVAQLLRKTGIERCRNIAKQMFPGENQEPHLRTLELSIASSVERDGMKRFVLNDNGDSFAVVLSPPAKETVLTLTEHNLKTGSFSLSRELSRMIEFYELGSALIFTVYGDYVLHGIVDGDLHRICGPEIQGWFEENQLEPGHKIHVRAPDPGDNRLKLYTLFEVPSSEAPPTKDPHASTWKYLRHHLYALFQEQKQYLHYREITSLLNSRGVDAKPGSVEAILSANTHLFCRRQPAEGIWGLTSWTEQQPQVDVSPTSLLIAIGEEAWVQRILEDCGTPLTAKEISTRLSDLFQVRLALIRELSFIDPKDPKFLQLGDGRWALSEWVTRWINRDAELTTELNEISRMQCEFHDTCECLQDLDQRIQSLKVRTEELQQLSDAHRARAAECASQVRAGQRAAKNIADEIQRTDKLHPRVDKYHSALRCVLAFGASMTAVSAWGFFRLKLHLWGYVGLTSLVATLGSGLAAYRLLQTRKSLRNREVRLNEELEAVGRDYSTATRLLAEAQASTSLQETSLHSAAHELEQAEAKRKDCHLTSDGLRVALASKDADQLRQEKGEIERLIELSQSTRRQYAS